MLRRWGGDWHGDVSRKKFSLRHTLTLGWFYSAEQFVHLTRTQHIWFKALLHCAFAISERAAYSRSLKIGEKGVKNGVYSVFRASIGIHQKLDRSDRYNRNDCNDFELSVTSRVCSSILGKFIISDASVVVSVDENEWSIDCVKFRKMSEIAQVK